MKHFLTLIALAGVSAMYGCRQDTLTHEESTLTYPTTNELIVAGDKVHVSANEKFDFNSLRALIGEERMAIQDLGQAIAPMDWQAAEARCRAYLLAMEQDPQRSKIAPMYAPMLIRGILRSKILPAPDSEAKQQALAFYVD